MPKFTHVKFKNLKDICPLSEDTLVTQHDDGTLNVWDTSTPVIRLNRQLSSEEKCGLLCKINEKKFARGHNNGQIEIWNINEDKPELFQKKINPVRLLDDIMVINITLGTMNQLVVSRPYRFEVWDLATSTMKKSCSHNTEHRPVNVIVLSNEKIAFATGNAIGIWNIKTHQIEFLPTKHKGTICSFLAQSSGHLASMSDNGEVIMWDMTNKKTTQEIATNKDFQERNYCITVSGETILINHHNGKLSFSKANGNFDFSIHTSFFKLDGEFIWIKYYRDTLLKVRISSLLSYYEIYCASALHKNFKITFSQLDIDGIEAKDKISDLTNQLRSSQLVVKEKEQAIADLKSATQQNNDLFIAQQQTLSSQLAKREEDQSFMDEFLWSLVQSNNFTLINQALKKYSTPKIEAFFVKLFALARNQEARQRCADLMLFIGVSQAQVGFITEALSKGANINGQNEQQEGLLHTAVQAGNALVVQLLLENNCPTELKNDKNQTALATTTDVGLRDLILGYQLFRAINSADLETVEQLLQQNINLYVKDSQGMTALHRAVLGANLKIIAALLSHGASPAMINATGETPLHLAAQNNQPQIVNLLLKCPIADEVVQDVVAKTRAQYGDEAANHILYRQGKECAFNSRDLTLFSRTTLTTLSLKFKNTIPSLST